MIQPMRISIKYRFGGEWDMKKRGDAINIKFGSGAYGGQLYTLKVMAVLGEGTDAYNASKDLSNGTVFAYGEDVYVKTSGGCLKLGSKGTEFWDYDNLKKKIATITYGDGLEDNDHPYGNYVDNIKTQR